MGEKFNMLTRTMRSKYAYDGCPTIHHIVCGSRLFCAPYLSIFEALFIFFNGLNERDVTLLAVGFIVMIVYPPFYSTNIDLFVGCMDGENFPHVIVCDVVFVFYLRIRQNIC